MLRYENQRTTRSILVGIVIQAIVACDMTAPVNPKDDPGTFVSNPLRTVSASGISATPVSWSEIDVAWPATSRADGYQLVRSTTGATGSYALVVTTAFVTYADIGLA